MNQAVRAEALILIDAGSVDAGPVRSVGTLDGVNVTYVSPRNGPGVGRLIASLIGGLAYLSWQAPGSTNPGPAYPTNAKDTNFFLEDGSDPSKFVRVTLSSTARLNGNGNALVYIQDMFDPLIAPGGDVAAADASAGLTTNATLKLFNRGVLPVVSVKLWLDPSAAGSSTLWLSSDNVNFYQPTSAADAHALSWATMATNAVVNVYVRRIIGAGASSAPSILNLIQYSWIGY